ncbi:hypothetical protein Q0590_15040 [Rhodocytophaga aerolata]|uniref:Lipoprotein n=1 Tax=Rhodocytophaga aerolata TaxID=455078 RepID=A0ABT8R8Q2_9BACT|nr:hypothetical protein [Rhodocytophaga aerolata]MDO1447583.1 hypothetical protein [Rhodocytophaga aerolata]
MKRSLEKIKSAFIYNAAFLALIASLSITSCGGRDYDTQSDKNFDNEATLPQSNNEDTTAPIGVRADSTPAANPDLDNNPVIDKGMSTDSAMRASSKTKQ